MIANRSVPAASVIAELGDSAAPEADRATHSDVLRLEVEVRDPLFSFQKTDYERVGREAGDRS